MQIKSKVFCYKKFVPNQCYANLTKISKQIEITIKYIVLLNIKLSFETNAIKCTTVCRSQVINSSF